MCSVCQWCEDDCIDWTGGCLGVSSPQKRRVIKVILVQLSLLMNTFGALLIYHCRDLRLFYSEVCVSMWPACGLVCLCELWACAFTSVYFDAVCISTLALPLGCICMHVHGCAVCVWWTVSNGFVWLFELKKLILIGYEARTNTCIVMLCLLKQMLPEPAKWTQHIHTHT